MQYSYLPRQVELDIQIHVFQPRWILAGLATVFGAYLGFRGVRGIEISEQLSGNSWDMVFIVFNNLFYVLIPFGTLFAYLISNVSGSNELDSMSILRLQTRNQWWYGKVLVTACAASLFTLLYVGGVLLISTGLNWSFEWSEIALTHSASVNLTATIIATSPVDALISMTALLFLGCFTIGLISQVIVVFTRRSLYGFIGSISIIWAAIIVNNLGLTPSLPPVFVHTHWVLGYHSDSFPLADSVVYWAVCIIVLVVVGVAGSRNLDFV